MLEMLYPIVSVPPSVSTFHNVTIMTIVLFLSVASLFLSLDAGGSIATLKTILVAALTLGTVLGAVALALTHTKTPMSKVVSLTSVGASTLAIATALAGADKDVRTHEQGADLWLQASVVAISAPWLLRSASQALRCPP